MSTIVYLHQHFKTPSMAGSSRSYEFARRLADDGHEVHVITGAHAGAGQEVRHDGLTVHWLGTAYDNRMSTRRRLLAFATFALKSALRARRVGGDIVFATSTPLTIAIPALVAVARTHRKFVFEVRDLWPSVPIALGYLGNPVLRALARRLEKTAYDRADAIVALSPGMADGIRPVTRTPVTVIPNASDIDLFDVDASQGADWRRTHGLAADAPVVLYAGTFGFVNNLSYMVELARHMWDIDPRVVFIALGDGAERQELIRLAREFDVLGTNFFIHDAVPKAAMAPALSGATVTCSWVRDETVLWDNSANKFFDSLAASRPIIINHRGWQAELIESRDLGLVLGPTASFDQARRLHEYLGDSARLHRDSLNARAAADHLFDRDTLFRQFSEVLEGC